MDRTTAKIAYQEIIRANNALSTLGDAIHIARDGCGCSIPTNTNEYIAKMHMWLLQEKRKYGFSILH